jgi:homoaconitase
MFSFFRDPNGAIADRLSKIFVSPFSSSPNQAFSGKLSFNPITDTLVDSNGKPFKFEPPSGDRLPTQGFDQGNLSYIPEPVPTPKPETQISISPESSRLEILKPFEPHWTDLHRPLEFSDLKCLIRIQGKCTTDEISAAGKWLKFKGHLSNIRYVHISFGWLRHRYSQTPFFFFPFRSVSK